MQGSERRAVAGARKNQLVAAAKARLKMGQHRADQNSQVGLGDRPENPHGNAPRRRAQINIGRKVVNRGAEAAIFGRDGIPQSLAHGRRIDGVMAADPGADRDRVACHAGRVQAPQDDR